MAGRQSQSSYDYNYDEHAGPRSPRESSSMGQRYINVDHIDPGLASEGTPEDMELTSGSARETDQEQTDDQSGPDDKMKGLFGKKNKKGKKDSKEKKDKEKKSKEKKTKEKKDKKDKTTAGGKGGGGLFSRFKKNKEPDKSEVNVDIPPDIDTTDTVMFDDTPPKPPLDEDVDAAPFHPQKVDMHPGGYSVNPSDTIQRGPTRMESMKRSLTSLVKLPPKKAGGPQDEDGAAVSLNEQQPQSVIRCSTFLNALLVALFVLGIVLTALGTVSEKLYVIGPVMIGLSLFALAGKVFFTLFWQEDPLPRISPVVKNLEKNLYGVGMQRRQMQQQQYGYWEGGSNVIAMQQFNYPAPSMDYQAYPAPTYTDAPFDPSVDDTRVPPEDLHYGRHQVDGDTSGYQLPEEFQRNQEYDEDTVERMKRISEGFPQEMAPSRPSRVSFHNNPTMPEGQSDSLDIGPDLSLGSLPGDPQAQGSFQEGELDQVIQPPSMDLEEQQAGGGIGAAQKGPAKGTGKKNCVIS